MHCTQKYNRINAFFMTVLHIPHSVFYGIGWWFLLTLCVSSNAFAQLPDDSEQAAVTIVLSEKSGSYAEFSNALEGILSVRSITHRVIDSTQPIPAYGLVIGVGTKAATVVAGSDAPAAINVLITKANHNKLLHDFPRRAALQTVTAIYLDQPIYRQVQLIAAVFPSKRKVGLIFSNPPKELAELQQKLHAQGLTLIEQAVDPALPLADALQAVLSQSEVLLALPDPAVYNELTIRNILIATYRSGIPLIGLSSGYVKAGALCAIFSTPAQIATQTAKLILKFGDSHTLPATQYPREFEIMVNEKVAHSLAIQVKDASLLHDEIMTASDSAP